MTTKDEALKQALEALEQIQSAMPFPSAINAIKMCRAALAQKDEQEPVAWCHLSYNDDGSSIPDSLQHCPDSYCTTPLYTAPPKRKPLTDEQIREIADSDVYQVVVFADGTKGIALDKVTVCDFARAVEAAHGIGGQQ